MSDNRAWDRAGFTLIEMLLVLGCGDGEQRLSQRIGFALQLPKLIPTAIEIVRCISDKPPLHQFRRESHPD